MKFAITFIFSSLLLTHIGYATPEGLNLFRCDFEVNSVKEIADLDTREIFTGISTFWSYSTTDRMASCEAWNYGSSATYYNLLEKGHQIPGDRQLHEHHKTLAANDAIKNANKAGYFEDTAGEWSFSETTTDIDRRYGRTQYEVTYTLQAAHKILIDKTEDEISAERCAKLDSCAARVIKPGKDTTVSNLDYVLGLMDRFECAPTFNTEEAKKIVEEHESDPRTPLRNDRDLLLSSEEKCLNKNVDKLSLNGWDLVRRERINGTTLVARIYAQFTTNNEDSISLKAVLTDVLSEEPQCTIMLSDPDTLSMTRIKGDDGVNHVTYGYSFEDIFNDKTTLRGFNKSTQNIRYLITLNPFYGPEKFDLKLKALK